MQLIILPIQSATAGMDNDQVYMPVATKQHNINASGISDLLIHGLNWSTA